MASVKSMNFYLACGIPVAFWEAYFHKFKGRETLGRSHNNLNTADDKAKRTESPSVATESWDTHGNFDQA